jgi:hypothetical protein
MFWLSPDISSMVILDHAVGEDESPVQTVLQVVPALKLEPGPGSVGTTVCARTTRAEETMIADAKALVENIIIKFCKKETPMNRWAHNSQEPKRPYKNPPRTTER